MLKRDFTVCSGALDRLHSLTMLLYLLNPFHQVLKRLALQASPASGVILRSKFSTECRKSHRFPRNSSQTLYRSAGKHILTCQIDHLYCHRILKDIQLTSMISLQSTGSVATLSSMFKIWHASARVIGVLTIAPICCFIESNVPEPPPLAA